MITACIVALPGMEKVVDCFLEAINLQSESIQEIIIATRTQTNDHYEYKSEIPIKRISFWFDRGPTPAGNTHWKGRGYSHAIGLHECLKHVITPYVLITEPDVIFLKKGFDSEWAKILEDQNLAIIGVTRAADPRGYQLYEQQATGFFPSVIACMLRMSELPPPNFLENKLKLRPHAFPHGNTEEDSYEIINGAWLLQGAIPEYKDQFPNPDGEYAVGCNLYLWFEDRRYLSFHHRPGYKNQDFIFNCTTYNLNNFSLPNDSYGEEPLLFHAGHNGLENLQKCLKSLREPMIEYANELEHVQKIILARNWPYRSPYIYADVVKDIIQNKVVCDVGCAEGDQLALFSQYARRVVGIEIDINRAKTAIDRGFEVIIGDYKKLGLPEADVYFCWIGPQEDEIFLNYLHNSKRTATVLLFCRKGNHVKNLVEKWKGRLIEFEYKESFSEIEGFSKEGLAWAGVIKVN